MKKVKGLVLESTEEHILLLTQEGEYLKAPGSGEALATGTELELEILGADKKNRFLPAFAAAAVIMVLTFSLALYSAFTRPAAYLALDINPSLYFSLNEEGLVIKAEPLNQDAEELLKGLQLQGKDIQEALSLILDGAYAGNYLSAEKENIILISLAAPESYVISENDLRVLVSERILNIEVDTYLKITTLEPQKALEARNKNLPVNLLVLEEQMAEKGLTEIGEEESSPQKKAGPPPTVQDFLDKVHREEFFEPHEFIRGKGPQDKRQKPEQAGPPKAMPQQSGKEGESPQQNEQQEEKPQHSGAQKRTPPGQANKARGNSKNKKTISPPGKDKDEAVLPGIEKKQRYPTKSTNNKGNKGDES